MARSFKGILIDRMEKIIKKKSCRICGANKFAKVLDLGSMPPANAFLAKKELSKPEEVFPLAVYFCKNCGLLQLRDVVHPKLLYTKYDYMSSASKPLADYLEALGNHLADRFVNSKEDLVIDIGGNDGTLLAAIKDRCRVLNIEPAKKIAKISRKNGVPVVNGFFSEKLAREVLQRFGPAAAVTANNVVAHIDDLGDLFKGIKILIGDKGIFSFDVHWVGNLIGEGGFDQIYHEHLCYFSLVVIKRFVEKMDLKVFDVQLTDMHGASLRVFVAKDRPSTEAVTKILKEEKKRKLDKISTFASFAKRVYKNRRDFIGLLADLKSKKKTIVGYGAPAKSNTLFNFCRIDGRLVDFIVDTTPFKQGLYAPGSKMPVLHPEEFKNKKPDYAILLAWNYADMIIEKEKEFRNNGGKFIIPVPKVRII